MNLFKLGTFNNLIKHSKSNKDANLAMMLSALAIEALTTDKASINNDALLGVGLPTPEEIEMKYPCEVGQTVIMDNGKSYDDTIKANYFRRQGAKWLLDLVGKITP